MRQCLFVAFLPLHHFNYGIFSYSSPVQGTDGYHTLYPCIMILLHAAWYQSGIYWKLPFWWKQQYQRIRWCWLVPCLQLWTRAARFLHLHFTNDYSIIGTSQNTRAYFCRYRYGMFHCIDVQGNDGAPITQSVGQFFQTKWLHWLETEDRCQGHCQQSSWWWNIAVNQDHQFSSRVGHWDPCLHWSALNRLW